MIPGTFDYHAPSSLDEAIALLAELGDEARVLAGGHSLLPMMKLRFAEPGHLVDLNGIEALRFIRESGDELHIGAMTTENELIASDLLWRRCPLIPDAATNIADPQVRNRGTIGGDIAHGDPGNDHPAIMMAVGASFVLQGLGGERTLPATEFFLGTYFNALELGEILREIRVPAFPAGTGYAYEKFKRKTGDWATAATAVVLEMDGGICRKASIALTNLGPTALKAEDAEQALVGTAVGDAEIEQAAQSAMAVCEPAEDLRGDIAYKTHMAGEMTRRAIRTALERAKG